MLKLPQQLIGMLNVFYLILGKKSLYFLYNSLSLAIAFWVIGASMD